jgi:hypothetical protein
MLKGFRARLGVVPSTIPRRIPRRSWSDILAFSAALCVLVCDLPRANATTTKQDALALLVSALDADELTRATIARQVDAETLLEALRQAEDVALRLAAMRCSPYLGDADRALVELAQIARGSDPELAPVAALRVFWIAQSLMQHSVDREIALDSVMEARAALVALADDRTALANIRLLAGQASFLLEQLLARYR